MFTMQDAINFSPPILDKHFLQIASPALSHRDFKPRLFLMANRHEKP